MSTPDETPSAENPPDASPSFDSRSAFVSFGFHLFYPRRRKSCTGRSLPSPPQHRLITPEEGGKTVSASDRRHSVVFMSRRRLADKDAIFCAVRIPAVIVRLAK
ncbi:hypothetical protein TNIN_443881 [Trichonephila inaurata madagascariensis]|uniref:Uncharacterized protein n=1 Tax=Trichonephila inaurata madagascariensis TaxID=2747483 RepID=A0A8X6J3F6_9ARAC|nr:hypothetical protein TNIN_443881 [Trichonephila inaurata madagascariensis]